MNINAEGGPFIDPFETEVVAPLAVTDVEGFAPLFKRFEQGRWAIFCTSLGA